MADIVTNPKARRDYHILETFEAGIVLKGTGKNMIPAFQKSVDKIVE